MSYRFIVRDSNYEKMSMLEKTANDMGLTDNELIETVEEDIPIPKEKKE